MGLGPSWNPAGKLRGMETRDLAVLSIMLMGYSPYLTAALETTLASLVEPRTPVVMSRSSAIGDTLANTCRQRRHAGKRLMQFLAAHFADVKHGTLINLTSCKSYKLLFLLE